MSDLMHRNLQEIDSVDGVARRLAEDPSGVEPSGVRVYTVRGVVDVFGIVPRRRIGKESGDVLREAQSRVEDDAGMRDPRRVAAFADHAFLREERRVAKGVPAKFDLELPVAVAGLQRAFPVLGRDLHDLPQVPAPRYIERWWLVDVDEVDLQTGGRRLCRTERHVASQREACNFACFHVSSGVLFSLST